jgi:uncharacterized membrane protein
MARLPLTRDQRTARAVSVFFAFTTTMFLGYWIVQNISVWVGCKFDAEPTRDGKGDLDLSLETKNVACELYYVIEIHHEEFELARRHTDYGNRKTDARMMARSAVVVMAIFLLLVFRLIQLAVRLGFPCADVDEDETETPG